MNEVSTKILVGDSRQALKTLPDALVHCCVTSPPYWNLRDYGHPDQIGLEETPEEYVHNLVTVFREVYRVLRDDGTCWVNLGDTYAGSGRGGVDSRSGGEVIGNTAREAARTMRSGADRNFGFRNKELIGIPWMVAFALRASGWILRQDIIWAKPNPMPASVRDRCTTAHEYLFLFVKSPKYFWNRCAMKEPAQSNKGNSKSFRGGGSYTNGNAFNNHQLKERRTRGNSPNTTGMRNRRSVWTISPFRFSGAHFATFPPKLIEPCILAGTPTGGTVIDPFGGSGTTAVVAHKHGRNSILCELNNEYAEIARDRLLVEILEGEKATQESTLEISKEFI